VASIGCITAPPRQHDGVVVSFPLPASRGEIGERNVRVHRRERNCAPGGQAAGDQPVAHQVDTHLAVEPAAHEAWVRARFHLQRRADSDLEACLAYANEATRIDPDFAPAHAVKAACHFNTTYLGTTPPAEAFFATKLAARRALALDERHAGAHVALAWALAAYDLDWDGAERNFARAIELNPGFDYARTDRAFFLAWLGRHEEAEAEARHALTISPEVAFVSQAAALVSYLARRFDEAIVRSEYALQLDSTYYPVYQRLGFAYSAKGMHGEAVAPLQQAVRLAPHDLRQRAFLGYMYAQAGQLEEANSLLIRLLDSSRHTYVPPTSIASSERAWHGCATHRVDIGPARSEL
jgi:Flp pilus assembly protein TadD